MPRPEGSVMTNMVSPDDTQPRSPFRTPPHGVTVEPPYDEPVNRGPGCFLWGFIGAFILGISGLIIALSGFAGWSAGTRIAQTNATATQNAAINEQISRIPADVDSRNQVLLQARIEYLATLTPGVPGLGDIMQTATAVYFSNLPTITPTPQPSPTTEPLVIPPTSEPQIAVTPGQTLDLNALLNEAQTAVSLSDWDTAIDTLDVILAADSTFESGTVRNLMLQALNAKALNLFRAGAVGDLAEAMRLTDRAREFGDVGELDYESYIAGLYLDALNTVGIDYSTAIRSLQQVYNAVPTYRDVQQLLFQQYVGYGDAWAAQGEYCPAAAQYQSALNLVNDPGISGKLSTAQGICAQATPVGGPTPLPGTPSIAPVGQPGA